jgi:hypothetical protein
MIFLHLSFFFTYIIKTNEYIQTLKDFINFQKLKMNLILEKNQKEKNDMFKELKEIHSDVNILQEISKNGSTCSICGQIVSSCIFSNYCRLKLKTYSGFFSSFQWNFQFIQIYFFVILYNLYTSLSSILTL